MCGSLGSRFCSENNGPVEDKVLASKRRYFKQEVLLHLGGGIKGRKMPSTVCKEKADTWLCVSSALLLWRP